MSTIIRMEVPVFTDPFIYRALAAGLMIALVAGPLGCFVVWRRMAYFGDSLAHSALLGVAFGFMVGLDINLGVMMVCALFALLLVWLQQQKILTTDSLLGILAHASLALGMVVMSMLETVQFDLHSYLFGNVLTVTVSDLAHIAIGAMIVLVALIWVWPSLVLMTLHEDLAKAEGVNVFLRHLLLMFLMTTMVAVAINLVGMLLITSLLIIPAAAARNISATPFAMACYASIIGMIAVIIGLQSSFQYDVPPGPAIVVAAFAIFLVAMFIGIIRARISRIAY